jgi:hypothetical protein
MPKELDVVLPEPLRTQGIMLALMLGLSPLPVKI